MKRPLAAFAMVAAALLAARPLPADPPGAKDTAESLAMTADHLDLDVEARTAVLTGNVRLVRGDVTVACPRVDLRYDKVPHVTWVKGSGGVVAEVKGVKAEAPDAELDLASQTMELQGGVRLTRGDGWIAAERATIHVDSGKVSMAGVKGSIPVPKPPR
jgi:lipopolysaccharide export system protein LptA